MKALLSTIGSRGDVQPLVALAVELRGLGHDVSLCVPPDFRAWIAGMGFDVTPIGPELRAMRTLAPGAALPTPEQIRTMIEGTVAAQFDTIAQAARGCDVLVGATALQVAAPSVAASLGMPYVFVAYCPAVLPSSNHAPPVLTMRGDPVAPAMADYSDMWAREAERWNATWREPLNARRASLGLGAIDDVQRYVHTSTPWLAADPMLAPWPEASDDTVFQSGAWILDDTRALSPEVERFLDDGDAPIYFGFGSTRVPQDITLTMVATARALGRRAIVSRGWADLSVVDSASDCLAIDDTNLQALFPRVAAVVHHGGAGTTTAAARAGAPQVVVAQHYDQHYWAQRVDALGIGTAHAGLTPTVDTLVAALERSLQPAVVTGARAARGRIRVDGARVAAHRLEVSGGVRC